MRAPELFAANDWESEPQMYAPHNVETNTNNAP
jgi:hypothetical protein